MKLVVDQQKVPINTRFDAPRNATITHLIAQQGTQEQLSQVLALQPDLEIRDAYGYTVMHYACMGGNKPCFDLLAENAE